MSRSLLPIGSSFRVQEEKPKPRVDKRIMYHTLKRKLDAAYEEIKQLRKENKELRDRLPSYAHFDGKELFPPKHGW